MNSGLRQIEAICHSRDMPVRQIMRASAVAIALLFVIIACEQECGEPIEGAEESFPNSVGSQWVYAVYDSITGSIDTAHVDIVRTVHIENDIEASVWKYSRSGAIWYRYMRTTGQRVIEYHDTNRAAGNTLYRFPLDVGNRWISNPSWGDTSVVATRDTVSFPARVFEDAVFVKRRWSTLGSSGRTDTWFVPNVGIVQLSLYWATSADTTCEVWELLGCTLEKQGIPCEDE